MPDGGAMNKTMLESEQSGMRRRADLPSKKSRLTEHFEGRVDENQERHDPNGETASEQLLEVLGVEMVEPWWEFSDRRLGRVGEVGIVDDFRGIVDGVGFRLLLLPICTRGIRLVGAGHDGD